MAEESFPHGPFPYSWTELSHEENKQVKEAFKFNDMIRYSDNVLLPRPFCKIADELYNLPVKEDDIWVITYPKCGTTWAQEMVWQIVNGVDKEEGKKPLFARSPFIELGCVTPLEAKSGLKKKMSDVEEKMENANEKEREGLIEWMKHLEDPIEYTRTLSGRRVIKSHLPIDFLPHDVLEKCKIVYIARNPKDCAVSRFHFAKTRFGCEANFDEFIKLFEANLLGYGSYWRHILEAYKNKERKNFTLIWFEEMKADQKTVIEGLCKFVDEQLSDEKVDELVEHLKFENMKQNKALHMDALTDKSKGQFMRKGKVGDWKAHFDEKTDKRWNKWILENTQGKKLFIPGN